MTTGARCIDVIKVGRLVNLGAEPQARFSERIEGLPGSGIRFHHFTESSVYPSNRRSSGGAIRFVSGGNLNKLIPETWEAWRKTLQAIPNSELFLYPFGPAWQAAYPERSYVYRIEQWAEKHGLQGRIRFCQRFQSTRELLAMLSNCDVYLDALPYSGATSLIDPVRVGLPMVVHTGEGLRFSQGRAMLMDSNAKYILATNTDDYVNAAQTLVDEIKAKQIDQIELRNLGQTRSMSHLRL